VTPVKSFFDEDCSGETEQYRAHTPYVTNASSLPKDKVQYDIMRWYGCVENQSRCGRFV
jgi:hypothetical protein